MRLNYGRRKKPLTAPALRLANDVSGNTVLLLCQILFKDGLFSSGPYLPHEDARPRIR